MNNDTTHDSKGQHRFTTILHDVRIELGLSLLEYCLYDSIHALSHNRWCTKSKENFAAWYGVDTRTIYRAIDKGIERGYLEKPKKKLSERDGRLRTTKLWYDSVVLQKKEMKKDVKMADEPESSTDKMSDESCQNVRRTTDKMSDYNNSDKNRITTTTVLSVFWSIFKEKIPGSLLDNPHIGRCVEYMVNLDGRDEIEKPLAYLRSLLRTPDEIPEMQEDPDEKEEEAVQDLEKLRDRIVENRNDSLEIADLYQKCQRAILLGAWDEVGRIKAEMAEVLCIEV